LEHRCIRQRFANGRIYRWDFADGGRTVTIDPAGTLTSNSLSTIVSASVRGSGICYVPIHHVAAQIESGQLVRLLEEYSLNSTAIVSITRRPGIRPEHSARWSIICEAASLVVPSRRGPPVQQTTDCWTPGGTPMLLVLDKLVAHDRFSHTQGTARSRCHHPQVEDHSQEVMVRQAMQRAQSEAGDA
jgi:hypothetical protein